jgi:phosphoribosyl 1,2-cyclic phosphodiesterase
LLILYQTHATVINSRGSNKNATGVRNAFCSKNFIRVRPKSSFFVAMSVQISSLNSGSNGNCYYIGNHAEAVLVDAGISCREIERRMARSGLNIRKVKAIFISHEHSDHIRGVETLSKKYEMPVYITPLTLRHGGIKIRKDLVKTFRSHEIVTVGSFQVTCFPKQHDASEPHSFVVKGQSGVTIGVFTDIGTSCEHVISNFRICHAAFLESNYDDQMLETGNYPYHLKKRIRSHTGHLSNEQALRLFTEHRSEGLSHLLLSHLSKDNNSPQLVHDLFSNHAGNTKIVVASRHNESEVFTVNGQVSEAVPEPGRATQMSLFA